MSLRDRILNAEDLGSEIVYIPEWDVKVEVRAMTVAQQQTLIAKVRKPNGDLNSELLAVETIIAACFDPETGERVFDDADRDVLRTKSASAFSRLLAASNRAAGMEDESQVVSRLDETQADAPSSS